MKTRKRFSVLTALSCVALFLVAIITGGVFASFKRANAYNGSAPMSNYIGEITLDKYEERTDGLVFNPKKLSQLYGKLVEVTTGNTTPLSDLATAKSGVDNSQSVVVGTSNSGTTDTTIVNGVSTQPKSLNFETMKNGLGGAPITLSFGGLDWTVVYATTNTTAGGNTQAGDLIVTLWLNDNVATTSQWGKGTSSTNANVNYPTGMYSSSYIRVKTLNAGGDDGSNAGNTSATPTDSGKTYYSTNTSTRTGLVQLADRKTNEFAKYTLSNSVLTTTEQKIDDKGNPVFENDGTTPVMVTKNPSLVDFLTVPKNVEYQRAENWVWSYGGAGVPYLLPNEAWGLGANGPDTSLRHSATTGHVSGWNTGTGGASNMSLIPNNNAYLEWSKDYLWLPSMTETGYHAQSNPGVSLWGIPNNDAVVNSTALGTSDPSISWLRSGNDGDASLAGALTQTGGRVHLAVSNEGGVRPALHLNLSAAAKSAAISAEDITLTYNGKGQDVTSKGDTTITEEKEKDVTSEKWYDADYFEDSKIVTDIRYTDKDGNTLPSTSPLPKEVGEYYVEFTLKNSVPYKWAGNPKNADGTPSGDRTKTIKITIRPKKLAVKFEKNSDGVPEATLVGTPFSPDKVNITIHYYDKAGTKDEGTNILDLKGKTEYQAEVEFDNANYVPDYDTRNKDNNKRLIFENPATAINIVWNQPSTGSYEFNGTKRGFALKDLDTNLVKATLSSAAIADGATAKSDDTFQATNAGTYVVDLELVNKTDYVWGSEMGDAKGTTGTAHIAFTITPKELVLKVNAVTPSDWSVYLGGSGQFDFMLPNLPLTLPSGTTLAVEVYAQLPGSSTQTVISAPITLNQTTQMSHKVAFDASDIIVLGAYNLGVKIANSADPNAGNFTFKLDKAYRLTIKEPVSSGDIIWLLFADGVPAGSMMTNDALLSDTYRKSITYDGKKYSFECTPFGYTVDTSYGTNGYRTIETSDTSTALTEVKNAGNYETTVCLSDGASKFLFTIEWKIDKFVYDLSDVYWTTKDGKVPFNEKGMTIELDSKTVPEGLTPVPGGVRTATKVGDKGTASVTFTVKDPVNYTLPTKPASGANPTTYTFNDPTRPSGFDWTIDWEVFPAEIPVDWTIGTIILKNDNNKKINGEIIAGGFDEYIEYDYYETDSDGNKLKPLDPPLTEPEVTDGSIRYYVAIAKIASRYVGSYIFDPAATAADLESPVFEAGNALTGVTLAAGKTAYIYWGQPVHFQFTVTSGTIAKDAFDIAYYNGLVRLKDAPTDPGNYSAYISLKSAYEKSYYIDGTSSFNFTIGCATITEKWNDNVKPPMLNLTENESKYISYEFCDDKGNIIGISDITTGDYSVRAKISDTTKYIFDNNTGMTGWHKFTVEPWDEFPTSPLPPFKDPVNPNDPGSGGPGGNGKIIDVNLTYEQLGQSQKFNISNDAGLYSAAFNVQYYNLDGTPVTNFKVGGAYKVVVTLVGDYVNTHRIVNPERYFTVSSIIDDGTTTPGVGNNPSNVTIVSYLPIILSGVSLVLIVVFSIMAFNNASEANKAKAKTKKLATMSYSVAPVGLLAMVLGLAESSWWAVAGVLMALALATGIVAFMFRAKKLKALEALEEEQARLEDEKEMARADKEAKVREEQIRRDNELRMMFASMQQSYQQMQAQSQQQPLIDYDMLQNMIVSSMQSLQSQQALPPAADTQKEIEDFHAQMAAQQAQMAAQQEMLAQILQNQEAQQNYAPMYAQPEYDNVYELDDDITWLGESEDTISLEESYGALTDAKKRYYYEIGSHIMNHPRTSQNDGKYAVLFKHRGKTIFKLIIVGDAPVLYYPNGDSGRSEIRIASSVSLDKAKAAVDRVIDQVDSELN